MNEQAPEEAVSSKPSSRRLVISIVLLAVAVLATPLVVVGVWTHSQLTNTDRYLATVGPLADDPNVQQYVAEQLTQAFEENVDLSAALQTQLPPALQSLSGTLGNALDGVVSAAANRFTQSAAFKTLWIDANRLAHKTVVKLLTGDLKAAELENGQLSINVGDALRTVQERLVADGLTVAGKIDLSNVDKQVVLADSAQIADLEHARTAVRLLHKLVWVLGIVAILGAVGSVLVASSKAAALKRLGIGLALAVVVVGVVIAAARHVFLSHSGEVVPEAVIRDLFDAVVSSLKFALRLVFVLSVATAALVTIVSLPTYAATWARPTQVAVSLFAAAALLLNDDPTWGYVLFVIAVFVVVEFVLELVRRRDLRARDSQDPDVESAVPVTGTARG